MTGDKGIVPAQMSLPRFVFPQAQKRDPNGSLFYCGATRNRTGDTRIFSPLLYQLSYGTSQFLAKSGCKSTAFF